MISSKRKTKTTNKTNNKVCMKGILPLGPGAGGIGVLRDWGSSWGQIIPYPSISSIQKKENYPILTSERGRLKSKRRQGLYWHWWGLKLDWPMSITLHESDRIHHSKSLANK